MIEPCSVCYVLGPCIHGWPTDDRRLTDTESLSRLQHILPILERMAREFRAKEIVDEHSPLIFEKPTEAGEWLEKKLAEEGL